MSISDRRYPVNDAATTTLSPVPNKLDSIEYFARKNPFDMETWKNKTVKAISTGYCLPWKKFANSQSHFSRFSRKDSATSYISFESQDIPPYHKENRPSVSMIPSALVMEVESPSETRYKGVKSCRVTSQLWLMENNESSARSFDKEYSRSTNVQNEDICISFAQLQIKCGRANVVYKRTRSKRHNNKKNRPDNNPMQKLHGVHGSSNQ